MIYEFIATITAAFALAGIALIIRHIMGIFKYKTPKWLTPVFAACGIFIFQIHQEYNWYEQTSSHLPSHVSVINTIESTSWYRPWSYIKPQISHFMAVDAHPSVDGNTDSDINNKLQLVNLYLFTRRMSTKKVPQLIDCQQGLRADYFNSQVTTVDNVKELHWLSLSAQDPLLLAVCSEKSM